MTRPRPLCLSLTLVLISSCTDRAVDEGSANGTDSGTESGWAAYTVGFNLEDRLYVHDYARDPFAPAVEVEGLPVGGLTLHFASDGSGMGPGEDFAPAFQQAYYVPLSEDGPGAPMLVHEITMKTMSSAPRSCSMWRRSPLQSRRMVAGPSSGPPRTDC